MPHRKPMIVRIPVHLWQELELDNVDKYQRVLAAMYFGFGPEHLRDLVQKDALDPEVTEILRVAPELGMTKRDKLVPH